MQAAHIQVGLAVRQSLEAERHRPAALCSLKPHGRSVVCLQLRLRDDLLVVLDLRGDPLLRKGRLRRSRLPRPAAVRRHEFREFLPRILFQHDALQEGLLALGDIQGIVFRPAHPAVRCKAEGQRVFVLIDLAAVAGGRFVLRPQVLIAVGEALRLLVPEGDALRRIREEIPDSDDLVERRPVIQRIVLVDHGVELAGLAQETGHVPVGQAPVILGVGYTVENGCIVFGVKGRIPVKRIRLCRTAALCRQAAPQELCRRGGISGCQQVDLGPGHIFQDARPRGGRIGKVSRRRDRDDHAGQEGRTHTEGIAVAAEAVPALLQHHDPDEQDCGDTEQGNDHKQGGFTRKRVVPADTGRRSQPQQHKGAQDLPDARLRDLRDRCGRHGSDQKGIGPHPPVGRVGEAVQHIAGRRRQQEGCQDDQRRLLVPVLSPLRADEQHAECRHRAESHIGPGIRQRRRSVAQKAVQEILIVFDRPQERDRLVVRRPRILQETQNDRQEDKGRQQGPQQSVPDKGETVEEHAAELPQPPHPQGPPDRVQDRHEHDHIEEVEIAHRREEDHKDEQSRLLAAEDPLTADQQEREEDKGIQEIVVPHAREREPVKDIDQGAGQDCDPRFPAQIEVVGTEGDAGQPEPDHEHDVVEGQQVFFRQEDRRQAEGIADHIVGQRREQVPSVTHAQGKGGQTEYTGLPELLQDLPAPSGEKEESVIMLVDPVRLPDEAALFQPEPHKDGRRRQAEEQGIPREIDQVVFPARSLLRTILIGPARYRLLLRRVSGCSFHHIRSSLCGSAVHDSRILRLIFIISS